MQILTTPSSLSPTLSVFPLYANAHHNSM